MANGFRVSFGSDENILQFDSGFSCTILCIYLKPLNCSIKNGEFHGKLYLNKILKTKKTRGSLAQISDENVL